MPRKRNLRMETYNKLINIGKSTEKDISNLKIEDLKEITKDPDVLNIIALREFIKEHNTIGYFNYQQTRKEESNGDKYQLVNEMANETIKYISQSSENWIEFLNTASNNYKYSFSEQVLNICPKSK